MLTTVLPAFRSSVLSPVLAQIGEAAQRRAAGGLSPAPTEKPAGKVQVYDPIAQATKDARA